MTKEIAGVPLHVFEDPIYEALECYSRETDGRVVFKGTEEARKLEITPTKPYSARSTVAVHHLGEVVGELYIIAFGPGDGSGDESTYKLAEVDTGQLPHQQKVIPRSKRKIHTEIHLTVAAQKVDEPQSSPLIYGGSLALLGFRSDQLKVVQKIAELGQDNYGLEELLSGSRRGHTTATLTVGYHLATRDLDTPGERFGDPHAVYNDRDDLVQVAGFFAISPEMAREHYRIRSLLGAAEPDIHPYSA